MHYATIVPQYVIDRLLTADLDVNFSMSANKCYASLDFFIFDANAFHNDADAKCPYDAHVSFQRCNYDANVLCRDEDMKFTHDGVSAHIQIAMQMSPCKDGDAKCLVVQVPSNGYVLMQMLLVDVS